MTTCLQSMIYEDALDAVICAWRTIGVVLAQRTDIIL